MSTDLTFITNEDGKTLQERFNVLLSGNTRFFDCLVGYFYVSGFFRIYRSLEHTEKIRILIGLSTNRTTYDLLQRTRQEEFDLTSHAETKESLPPELLRELEKADDSTDIEQGIRTFIQWIRSGKLEVRVYPTEKIHAKVYIMTFVDGHIDAGRVITGSSNFTQAGLQDNLEFNVELKNRSDYEFALAKFNELWTNGVDVAETYVETIERKSPYAQFTPYELYLKLLYEYFRGELNRPEELEDVYLPTGFKKLRYQEEAVLSAKRILDEYGGVFLSDVVGLGKTYMSAMLARELSGRSLVIAPPALLDKTNAGSWPNVFSDFRAPQTDFESIGKLDDLLRRDSSKYANVFIDESHRFRTETNQTYEKLAQICRGKRVILVSATPLNNYPRDILSQVKLFQPGKNSTLPNLRNMEALFVAMEKRLKGLDRQKDRDEYLAAVRLNAKETRERVLKYLMIRRTRSEIEKYYGADMQEQGVRFPEVADPEPLFYYFGPMENEVLNHTISRILRDFKYARYKPLVYYERKLDDVEVQGQINLARFMRILLVKRLESSFHAFRLTLDRFIQSHERVIAEVKKGFVYISKKHIHKIFEYLEAGDEEGIQNLLETEKAERLDAGDFRPEFLKDLENDLAILHEIRDLWKKIKRDPKWTEFQKILTTRPELQQGKLLIFSESRETVEYLVGRIREHVDARVISFSGQSDETARQTIIANFDARAYRPSDDFRILVTTDVLAEGVNLHRAAIVINYDIPWNPTRLMQRVGRINRVDTPFDTIRVYNFFPTDEGDDIIKLKDAAAAKIHAFIEMLGTDARLLTDGEEIKAYELFGRLNSKRTITGEDEEEDTELEYLTDIRRVRDQQPDLFERIKHLPRKARSTRLVSLCNPGAPSPGEECADGAVRLQQLPALLTYFRQDRLDKFFLCQTAAGVPSVELDFLTAARTLRPSDKTEPRQPIPPAFYGLLDQNKHAFVDATSEEGHHANTRRAGRNNDTYILQRLRAKEIHHCKTYTEDDEEFIRQVLSLLDQGALPRPTTKKLAEALRKEIEPLKVLAILRRDIPIAFLRAGHLRQDSDPHKPREVILSSWIVQYSPPVDAVGSPGARDE